MKKILLIMCLLVFSKTMSAQIGVTDVALNKKLLTQLANNGVSLAYEKIKKLIAEGLLSEAEKLSKQVDEKYKLMDTVFTANSELRGFKKIKNSLTKADAVNSTISVITGYLKNGTADIPAVIRKEISKAMTKSLDDMRLAQETIDYALNDDNKLTLKQRVDQLDAADLKLEDASLKLAKSITYIKSAMVQKDIKTKRDNYFNLKYKAL